MVKISSKAYREAKHLIQCGLKDGQIMKVVSIDKDALVSIRGKKVAHSKYQVEQLLKAHAVKRLMSDGWKVQDCRRMLGYKSDLSVHNLDKCLKKYDGYVAVR